MTGAIVRSSYRYKRPPRKRKVVALEVPAIVTRAKKPGKVSSRIDTSAQVATEGSVLNRINTPEAPATPERKSAIVTVRHHKRAMHAHLLEDLTPEELQRRGDAAVALWRELVRRVNR